MQAVINGKTKVFGIIGHPIQHTFSPLLQNTAFEACQIDAAYLPFEVHPNHLKEAVEGMRSLHIAGINVTLPHKIKIMPYLDEITPTAQRIGAINTIQNDAGTLIGTNTDGVGFLRSLAELDFSPLQKTILILGAGGAARSILVTLAEAQAKRIVVVNRTPEKAMQLTQEFAPIFPQTAFQVESLPQLYEEPIDLLINTTNMGMKAEAKPADLSQFKHLLHVADIIYTPSQTPLLKQAKRLNIPCLNGIGMLLHQGCAAFEFWTKQPAPVARMEATLRSFLNNEDSS